MRTSPWVLARYAVVWAAVVAAAGLVVWAAVGLALRGTNLTPTDAVAPPRTPASNAHSPQPPPVSPSPSGPAPTSPAPSPDAVEASQVVRGGTVVASCVAGKPRVKAVIPADGWAFTTGIQEGEPRVEFVSGSGAKQRVEVSCRGGRPAFEVE